MKKILIFLLLVSQFGQAQNLFARQNFAGGGVPTFNTYIGGVSGSITSATQLGVKLGISNTRIQNFTIVGSDIKCKITGGGYAIPNNAFQNTTTPCTYYRDTDFLVTSVGDFSFYYTTTGVATFGNIDFKNATSIGSSSLASTKAENISLLNCTTVGNRGFWHFTGVVNSESIYIPNCTSLGTTAGDNEVFTGISSGSIIYTNPVLATNNAGAPDGDLAYATGRGAIVRYVTDFTAPNNVTTLAAGNIYNNAIQLNFTTPSSTNAIDYYECYANGVFKNKIAGSGGFITGLTQNTNQDITVIAVDIFYNKSIVSNTLNATTANNAWDISTGLISYYKLDSNSNDIFGSNNGVSTSVSYVSGKVNNAGSYNGTTSKTIIGNPTNLQLNSGTISCWIKASASGSSYRSVFGKTLAYNLFLVDGVLMCYNWGSFGTTGNKSTGVNLNDGNWHHIVFVFDSGVTNGSKIYIDNVLSLTFSMSVLNQTDNVCIGSSNSTQFINALIDEPNIYSTKLTATEINILWNGGAGTTL